MEVRQRGQPSAWIGFGSVYNKSLFLALLTIFLLTTGPRQGLTKLYSKAHRIHRGRHELLVKTI